MSRPKRSILAGPSPGMRSSSASVVGRCSSMARIALPLEDHVRLPLEAAGHPLAIAIELGGDRVHARGRPSCSSLPSGARPPCRPRARACRGSTPSGTCGPSGRADPRAAGPRSRRPPRPRRTPRGSRTPASSAGLRATATWPCSRAGLWRGWTCRRDASGGPPRSRSWTARPRAAPPSASAEGSGATPSRGSLGVHTSQSPHAAWSAVPVKCSHITTCRQRVSFAYASIRSSASARCRCCKTPPSELEASRRWVTMSAAPKNITQREGSPSRPARPASW